MRPDRKSNRLLGVTRSKAKMIEYHLSEEYQKVDLSLHPNKLFTISIGLLGDLAAAINRGKSDIDAFSELKTNLLFAARFFDAYLQSKMNEALDPYLALMGAASYYLCDLPGSALVLAKSIDGDFLDLDSDGLEDLLLWLLQADFEDYFDGTNGSFGEFIDRISKGFLQFFKNGMDEENLLRLSMDLRKAVYKFGTPRQLLFGDVTAAVLRKKIENSVWKALPLYSGLSRDKWLHVLQKDSFIKELWPAQHLLGQEDVLKGKSVVVQMPTSAGKTKAMELILRSAFLADRVSLAIIIAPFRALCHEIKNTLVEAFHNESVKVDELSDALQVDFEISELLVHHQILVVTPEKLVYVLRHTPELAVHVGLVFFDEGHQFDSGTRGVTYELLLTSLRSMIPESAQKVLISAVISNAEAVSEWLNGESNVVEGKTLIPTLRSVGFTSWLDQLGKIEYVNSRDAEQSEFFVPRILKTFKLRRNERERKDRFFPKKTERLDIALYLGLKLAPNGGVAVFCGTKQTAARLCEKAVEIIKRDVPLDLPSKFSDVHEVKRLRNLYVENLGFDAPASHSAEYGIFSHHGNTPHGIRLAVEHAMHEDLVRFVACTSTLAQGVNLPIRYLIVTSVYQGMEPIKVRDFHNLIGRAGRAGMYTEGSILFADPALFDNRKDRDDKWRWRQVKKLLEPNNSEPCISNLLSVFDPIKSDDDKYSIVMDALDFVKTYIADPDRFANHAKEIAERAGGKKSSINSVEQQIAWKISLICTMESFLLSHGSESEDALSEANVSRLAEGTLAFFLADGQKKEHIRELFQLLARNISAKIKDPVRRKIYGRTLYGIQDAQAIESWVKTNVVSILSIVDGTDTLDLAWPLLARHINRGIFTKFDKPEALKETAHGWISGKSFGYLLEIIRERQAKKRYGTKQGEFKIDDVVDVCEGALAYEGALVVGAVCEFIKNLDRDDTRYPIKRLELFQKQLKYGLPTETTIAIYELGFSDRVIAQDIATSLKLVATRKKDIVRALREDRKGAKTVVEKYPSYFQKRMNELLH